MFEQAIDWFHTQAQSQIFGGIAAASALGYLGFLARNLPRTIFSRLDDLFTVEMTVRSDDTMYSYIAQWLSEQKFMARSRRLKLVSSGRLSHADHADAPSVPSLDDGPSAPQWMLVPATGQHWMFYRGKLLFISVDDGSDSPGTSSGGSRLFVLETMRFRTIGRNSGLMRALIQEATTMVKAEYRVRVFASEGSYWNRSIKKIPRPLRSVITANSIGETLLEDMRQFLSSRDWYTDRGIPWRRGYLFNGPPGTGKSSLVMALASELRCAIYTISLGTAITDGDVAGLLTSVPERAIVLIEDIDTFNVAQSRKSTQKEGEDKNLLTLSGLLNALDGVAASEGRIVIMTTNHPERLDAALTRPGRVDVRARLEHFTPAESLRMWKLFFGDNHPMEETFSARIPADMQPAALQELMMRNAGNPIALTNALAQQEAA